MKDFMKIILFIFIFVVANMFVYSIRKIDKINQIYEKNEALLEIENFSYEIGDTDKVAKKDNILRVDKIKENKIYYIDLNENIAYTFFNENMTMDKRSISDDMVSVSLIKFDNSLIEKISDKLKVKVLTYFEYYTIETNEMIFTLNGETCVVEKIENKITGDVQTYSNYKLGDEVEDIQMPDIQNYKLNESL